MGSDSRIEKKGSGFRVVVVFDERDDAEAFAEAACEQGARRCRIVDIAAGMLVRLGNFRGAR